MQNSKVHRIRIFQACIHIFFFLIVIVSFHYPYVKLASDAASFVFHIHTTRQHKNFAKNKALYLNRAELIISGALRIALFKWKGFPFMRPNYNLDLF